MAIGATCIWNIQTDGSAATAGGGYTSGGTDYSKTLVASLPANNTVTTATSAGAGNTLLTAQASADWVGNLVIPTAGTNMTLTAGVRYEILSVVVGVSVTFSTNISGGSIATGIVANGAFIVGGAAKFYNSATDDTLLENSVAGHKWYIKTGTHSCTGGVTLAAAGTAILGIIMEGYNATQGDAPSIASGNQPVIDLGASSYNTQGASWEWRNLQITETGSTGFVVTSTRGIVRDCKITNTSATINRPAITLSGANIIVEKCDIKSTVGNAIVVGNFSNIMIRDNYLHDSNNAIRTTGVNGGGMYVLNNIIDTMQTTGIDFTAGAVSGVYHIRNNTLYGAATPAGSSAGLAFAASSGGIYFKNNIVTGWVSGVNGAGSISIADSDYNCFYNNTTNRTNWATGTNDIATDPTFADAPNADFRVGSNMKALGMPSTFPGASASCISYVDIGAVQRKEDYPTITSVKFNDVFSNSELTGSYRWDTITSAQIAVGINHIQDGVTFTGTLASEVWSTITAAQIKMGVNQIQNSMTVTGTFSGETWTTLSSAYIANGQSQIQNSVTVTGTLLYPVAMSGTAGTVDIANIKENIRYILYVNNTSTGAPVSDISSGLTNRVKDVFKIHPEKILLGGHQMPALTTYMTSKNITAKTIAANQVAAKREAELTFSIVGLVTNQMVPNTYTSDQLDDDIEYLMENVEKVLRNYGDIGGYTRWSFPNSVTYHSSALDERNQLRVGILDLQCKVFY